MAGNSQGRWRRVLLKVVLPAALAGTVLGGSGWMLAGQGGAEAAARKAEARPATATKYDRVLGNIYYKVPAGFRAVEQKGGVIMVRQSDIAAGDLNGYLLLTKGLPLDAMIQAKLKAAGKTTAISALAIAIGGLADDPDAKLSPPQLGNNPAEDGYEGYFLVSKSADKDAGKTRFTQYFIVVLGDRAEIAMRVAYDSAENLERLKTGFDSLATSMEFRSAGAPAPTRLAAALPTDLAAIAPKVEPEAPSEQARGKGGGGAFGPGVVCRTEQRQGIYFIPYSYAPGGGGGGSRTYIYPQRVCRKNGKLVR